jgi:small subunit ribosomal protein S8
MGIATDTIADMLNRIHNAIRAKHDQVDVPASRLKLELAKLLRSEGFIQGFELLDRNKQGLLRVTLRYSGPKREPAILGVKRVSSPGRRVYVKAVELPKVQSGLGVAVISTSSRLMTDREARRRHLGGEVLCYIW